MPKTKRSGMRKKFDYNRNRKNVKKKNKKKYNPRIENPHIRKAWDDRKSIARNLQEMGLAFDPNRALPVKKQMEDKAVKPPVVTKPYILHQLEEDASIQGKNTRTLSTDLIEYVQHMIREHGEDYKAMARDEKNYYQDTPKQIKRKISEYKRCHPQHYEEFSRSVATPEPTGQ
ncbi:nucleolar protein 16 [Pholidichthys leucotaenia]